MAFHRHGSQMPLTPPDSGSRYGYSNMHYSQKQYPSHQSMNHQTRHEEAYDYHQAYMPQPLAPVAPQFSTVYAPSMYQNPVATTSMTTLPPISSYSQPMGAPVLPPLRMQNEDYQRSQYDYSRDQSARQVKEEKATGGVSAKLDYDMDRMTNFVVSTAQKIYQSDVVSPPQFRRWVHQVLSATRLPSATIMLSLHYLSHRIKVLPHSIPPGADQIYRLLAVALILGSKFLDDNTFINRSWSDVTSIKVSELNSLERIWLELIDHRLHVADSSVQVWVDLWQQYDLDQTREQHIRLSPLDTGFNHASQGRSRYPLPYSSSTLSHRGFDSRSHYPAAPYSAVDPWARTDRTYEDFYKRGGNRYPLSEFDDANRRAADEQRQVDYQYSSYQSAPYSAAAAPGYAPWDYSWANVHRSDCGCNSCSYRAWKPHTAVNGYGTVMG